MKDTLRAGLEGVYRYRVPESGTHERHLIEAERFARKLEGKRARAGAAP
jgi:hypothetical protein